MEVKNKIIVNILIFLIFLPIIYLFTNIFSENNELTIFIFSVMLPKYLKNTSIILIMTILLTLTLGILTAYFESFYEYRVRKFFKYMVIFSFAIPSYVLAYTYYENFNIANIYGVIFIYSISFFPYVYLFSRNFFQNMPLELIENAKLLGKSNVNIFFNIIIPISQMAIMSGLILVVAEVLNDFGVANYLGVQVFSTGIYEAYYSDFDIVTANKLSIIVIFIIFFILFINYFLKRRKGYYIKSLRNIKRERLSLRSEILVTIYFIVLFLISFIYPLAILIKWLKLDISRLKIEFLYYTINSIELMLKSSVFIIIVALILTNIDRLDKNKSKLKNLLTIGYVLPGVTIALAFLQVFIEIDKFVFKEYLFLSNSAFLIILAYTTRFINIPYFNFKSNILKTGNVYHENSRLLGKSRLKTFFSVDFYLMKKSIINAFLIVSIEIIKELSLTNILSKKTTLAIAINNYAGNEDIYLTSAPSLIIIVISFILIYIYNKEEKNELF